MSRTCLQYVSEHISECLQRSTLAIKRNKLETRAFCSPHRLDTFIFLAISNANNKIVLFHKNIFSFKCSTKGIYTFCEHCRSWIQFDAFCFSLRGEKNKLHQIIIFLSSGVFLSPFAINMLLLVENVLALMFALAKCAINHHLWLHPSQDNTLHIQLSHWTVVVHWMEIDIKMDKKRSNH